MLYPFTLRDTLLRAAAAGMYQVRWSAQILAEARRNLVASGRIAEAQAARLVAVMEEAFPDAQVRGFESLIPHMLNDVKDRHVTAAAVAADAQFIVTRNLKDFVGLPEGIEAQSPDAFLLDLFDRAPYEMIDLLDQQAAALRRPPVPLDQLLVGLATVVPSFCAAVEALLAPAKDRLAD